MRFIPILIVATVLAPIVHAAESADAKPVTVATSPKAGGHIHPSICQAKDGTLVVVYKGPQVLMRTRSTDGGKTWEQSEAISTSAKQPDLSKRFLAHLAQIDKNKTSGKKLYAACLFHADKGLESMSYIEKDLRGGEDDLPLLLGYYRLAECLDKMKASATVPKLVGKVVDKPFEAIVELQRAKFFFRESREEYLPCLRRAINYNPLEPGTYFSYARGSKEKDEQMDYCAYALFLTERGTELSSEIIDFQEKSQSK